MTINSTSRQTNSLIGNGNTATYPFSFKVFTDADVVVKKLETSTSIETKLILGLNNDYIVTLNDDQNGNPGGSITLKSGGVDQNLASGFSIVITSAIEAIQGTDLTNQGGFFPEVINDALDKSVILHQQQQTELDRSIKLAQTNTIGNLEITENVNDRKGKFFTFDDQGDLILTTSGVDTNYKIFNDGNTSGSVTGAVERTLTDKLADIVNVADFGAKGDGVTDDTLSLQDAINFCITNGGKELQLNAGVYVLTQNLLATIDEQFEQLHIKGNGNVIFKCIPTLTTLSTIAIANKNIGAINTSTDPDFSSVVGNVSINATNPSASGFSGGFNTGQNYIWFSEAGSGSSSWDGTSGSERSIAFAPIDASNLGGNGKVTRIEIDAIVGTDDNGGEYPDKNPGTPPAPEWLELRYSTDNGANFNLIGQIIPIQDQTLMSQTVTQYFIDIPTAAQVSNVIFQLHQPSNTGVDNYGITNIRYLNLTADNFLDITITSNHYASGTSTGAPRFSIRNIEFAYANQTQSVLATGINLKGSNITGQHTQMCVIESCQFVPWTNTANSTLFESFFSAAVKINDLHGVSFKNCDFYGEFDPEGTTAINNVFGRTAPTVNGQSGISVFISSTDNTKLVGNYYFDTCTFLYGLYGIYNGPYAFSIYINNCLFQQNTTGIYIDTINTYVDTTFGNGSVLRITNSVFDSGTKQSDPPIAANALNSHYCLIASGSQDIQISNSLFVSGKSLNANPAGERNRGCIYLSDSGRININGNNFVSTGAGANNSNIYNYTNYRNTGIVIANPNVSSTSVDSLIQGNNFYGFASVLTAVYLTATSKEIQCYEELNVFNDCGNNIYNLGTNNITSLPSGATALGGLTNVTLSNVTNGQVLKYDGSAWVNGTDNSGSGATDLSNTANGTSLTIESSTGNNTSLPAATTSAWGVMTDDDKTKLVGIENNATADQTDAEIKTAYENNSDTNAFTDAEKSKLTAIEASADVTDATNVDAAGAVMNTDASTTAMSFVVDEDNMASDSATKVPTQQSVKAYVDTSVSSVGGAGLVGGGNEEIFVEVENTMDNSFTTTAGKNYIGLTSLAIASGVVFTVTDGTFVSFT